MRTLKLTLAYDGAAYYGWQIQARGPSVQAVLEKGLLHVTGETIRATASGRTDSGVHALGQVVSFETHSRLACPILLRALNANLPEDLVVLDVEEAPPGFHASYAAIGKRYRYVLHDGRLRDPFLRHYCWHIFRPLDEVAMQRAADRLHGEHDFASFQSAGSPRATTVRTVMDLTVRREPVCATFFTRQMAHLDVPLDAVAAGESADSERNRGGQESGQRDAGPMKTDRSQTRLIVEIEATGFLYNMVRNIVGTLVLVGRGDQPDSWVDAVLAARDRTQAGPTAPPQGLFLVRVDYPC